MKLTTMLELTNNGITHNIIYFVGLLVRLGESGHLQIMDEEEEHVTRAKERINYVLSGCKCKTGCNSNCYKCRKVGRNVDLAVSV